MTNFRSTRGYQMAGNDWYDPSDQFVMAEQVETSFEDADDQEIPRGQDEELGQSSYKYLIVMHCASHQKFGDEIATDPCGIGEIMWSILNTKTIQVQQTVEFNSKKHENLTVPTTEAPSANSDSSPVIYKLIEEMYEYAGSFLLAHAPHDKTVDVSEVMCLVTDGPAPLRQLLYPQLGRKECFMTPQQRAKMGECCTLFQTYFDLRRCHLNEDRGRRKDASLKCPPTQAPQTSKDEGTEIRQLTEATISLLQKGFKFSEPEIISTTYESGICSSYDTTGNKETVIRARGLPWQSSDQDIANFFKGLNISKGGIALCLSPQGRRNGEAFVKFEDAENRDLALKRHKHHMGSRYIEVYKASLDDFLRVATGSSNEVRAFLSTGAEVIIRMRGLPYDATQQTILNFFGDHSTEGEAGEEPETLNSSLHCLTPSGILFVKKSDGRPTGDAFVLFTTECEGKEALTKHRRCIGTRYIELFRSTGAEVQQVLNRSIQEPKLTRHIGSMLNGHYLPNCGPPYNNVILIPNGPTVAGGSANASGAFVYPSGPHYSTYYGSGVLGGPTDHQSYDLTNTPGSTMFIPIITSPPPTYGLTDGGPNGERARSPASRNNGTRSTVAPFHVSGFDTHANISIGFNDGSFNHQRVTDNGYHPSLYNITGACAPNLLNDEGKTQPELITMTNGADRRSHINGLNLPLLPPTMHGSPPHITPISPMTTAFNHQSGGNSPVSSSVTRGNLKNCIRLRGLPFESKVEHVIEFLGDHAKSIIYQGVHMIFNAQGQPSGESFIQMKDEAAAQEAALLCHNKYMRNGKKQRYIEVFQCSGDDMNTILSGGFPNRPAHHVSPQFVTPFTFIPTLTSPHLLNGAGGHTIPPLHPYQHYPHPIMSNEWINSSPLVNETGRGFHKFSPYSSPIDFIGYPPGPYPSPPLSPSDADLTGLTNESDDSNEEYRTSSDDMSKSGYDVDVKGAKIISIKGLKTGISKDELMQLFCGNPEIHEDMIEIMEASNEARIIVPAETDRGPVNYHDKNVSPPVIGKNCRVIDFSSMECNKNSGDLPHFKLNYKSVKSLRPIVVSGFSVNPSGNHTIH